MTRLIALSILNLIRNPLRQAVLYPWVILTVERWAEQRWHLEVSANAVVSELSIGAIGVGALLCLITMVQFVVDGAGTAEGYAEPLMLIRRGLFRWTRNPLYLGMAVILLGESAYYSSVPLLIYALFWIREFARRVRREERSMLKRFGDSYLRYCETTPRWLPGLPGSAVVAVPAKPQNQPASRGQAPHRRLEARPEGALRNKILGPGLILTVLALVGYLDSYLGIFSSTGTPFLWFDPAGNLIHLVPGLALVGVASVPRPRAALAAAYRPLLAVVGLALLAAAVAGFTLARPSAPNILGVTNFENPVENVIHWLIGMQCLFAATRKYLASSGDVGKAARPT